MKMTAPQWVLKGGPDNTDIEDGDGGGSNGSQGCGDNSTGK